MAGVGEGWSAGEEHVEARQRGSAWSPTAGQRVEADSGAVVAQPDGVRAHGIKKFETLSYLPPLSEEALLKQIDFLIRSKWVPCLEFSKVGFIFREHGSTPGYYDGRYWTMWKLPMFGCTDASQVIKEVEEVKKEYPDAYVRIIGFDNIRQVQCVSFIAFKPPGCEESGKA
uniref:Uncharacterized protein n=1 Tax=Avena sativa TaxID=4498 RepID=A0ACD6AT34_AVESA